ncbi:MAG: ATP-binding cassette domain-containing protein [Cuspidothrix sp.]
MTNQVKGMQLNLEGLRKSFGNQTVLQGIDLEIQPGEFLAIVGRSGCGKSTMLRLIAGLDNPTGGDVLLNGKHSDQPINPAIRMMFQDARLLPWQRVLANVELGLMGSNSQVYAKQTALQVLRQVGLEDRAHEWPSVLSGGQRQRVALARALASKPSLLLLDEPLGALDALTRIEMQQLLEGLWREQGFTALLITHDVEEAVVLADRVVLIENGQISMDVKIDLPRPRARGDAKFAKTVEQILDKVMGKQESSQTQLVSESSSSYVLSSIST